jgi:HSP20 family protein
MTSTPQPGTFDRVRQEMDRWLETARVTGERALDAVGLASETRPLPPQCDVVETETDLHVLVDLPGVPADAVDLSLSGQALTVKARRLPPPLLGEGAKWHLRERLILSFERTLNLPAAIEPDSVRAVVRDGLLQIVLRKVPQPPSRTIPIQREAEPPAG